jgi:C4-dicarboxylate-specific signal transduction histidine kinase
MIRAGSRAGEVTSRIRALVAKSPPRRHRLNINDTIREVMALIGSEVQRNRISLRTERANDVPLFSGDRIQLQQVILNLILNAIEAMSEVSESPREMSVASAKDGSNSVLVTVRDLGPGIDATALERLFEASHHQGYAGIGCGQPNDYQAHGGRLATRNTPRGRIPVHPSGRR